MSGTLKVLEKERRQAGKAYKQSQMLMLGKPMRFRDSRQAKIFLSNTKSKLLHFNNFDNFFGL